MPCNSKNFQHIEKMFATSVYNFFSYTAKVLSRLNKKYSSSDSGRVEKCSFEKNAFKSLTPAYLLFKALSAEGCNFQNNKILGTRPFAHYC